MVFTIEKATKEATRGRIGLVGPAGSGKTYTMLVIATELAGPEGKIVVIDTEHKSSAKYADLFEFDVLHLENNYDPDRYVEAIQYCEEKGYDVIGIDSLTHAWTGKGGALEQVDKAAARSRGNKFVGWRTVTPKHNNLVDAMLQSDAHILATIRAKTDYAMDRDKDGKTTITKVGLAPIQREGMDYEFDIVFDIDHEHRAIVSKTRCAVLTDEVFHKLSSKDARIIKDWLSDGVTVEKIEAVPASKLIEPSIAVTFKGLCDWALKERGYDEDDVKEILKKAGYTGFLSANWNEYVHAINTA